MAYVDKINAGGELRDIHDTAGRQMIAPIELTSTATAAHAKGEYFIYNDTLYEATSAIAVGGTITPNTNCTAVPDGVSNEFGGEISQLKSAVSDLEAGSLSALEANEGQFPTADGEGSWSWETPDFIKATDPATGQTIYIPEVKDNQVSEIDVWSSNKINSKLADKQDETIVDTEGDFTATTVEGALHELHDAIESNIYTAGAGIEISAQNVISIKDRQLVHREITLTEDTKTVTVQFGAKIQEVFVNAVIPNAYDAGYSVFFRALNSGGTELAKHYTNNFTSTGSNNKYFRLKFAMNEFGICEFSSIGATDSEGIDDYGIVQGPARFRVIDPDSPTGISMQLGLGSQSTIKFKTGAKFDCYAILQGGESV